jgi:hypothetical protein
MGDSYRPVGYRTLPRIHDAAHKHNIGVAKIIVKSLFLINIISTPDAFAKSLVRCSKLAWTKPEPGRKISPTLSMV